MLEYSLFAFAGIEFPFHIGESRLSEPFPLHTHTFTELSILLDGSAIHQVEAHAYNMGRGEVFVITPPFSHAIPEVNDLVYYNFIFDLDKLMQLDTELRQLPGFQALFILEPFHRYRQNFTSRLLLDETQLAFAVSLCRAMLEEYDARREGYRMVIKSYFLSFITFIARQLVPERESISVKYFQISETVRFMEEHYKERITLSQLAHMSFLSERHYARLFQAVYGKSPIEHLIHCRLDRACALIRTTRLGLTEIAGLCGFGDKVSFSRQFRQRFGITPGQFKKADRS